jgi:amino acid transporter
MAIETLCPPALIYLVFSITQILIDTSNGLYNTALMKFLVTIIFTTLLNYLCIQGLGTISWIIVFIPFILMTLIIALLLLMFGMDPKSGRLNLKSNDVIQPQKPDARRDEIQKQMNSSSKKMPMNTSVKNSTSSAHDLYFNNQTNKIVDVALQQ